MAGKTTFGIDAELKAISEYVIGKIHYLGLNFLERAKTDENCSYGKIKKDGVVISS